MTRDLPTTLQADVPNQPSEEQLEADRLLSRFTIVPDREGYSRGLSEEIRYSCAWVPVCSVAVALAGSYWMVERIMQK